MKIAFGKLKNRNLIIGKNEQMRPTTAMAKSKIFNIIEINQETVAIDLFAGTGSLGFEAISLGAKKVIFTDNNKESFLAIKKNIEALNIDNAIVYLKDFRLGIKALKEKVNLIFLDPPFIVSKYYDEALDLISEKQILSKNGIIVLEKPNKTNIIGLKNWDIFEQRNVGEKDILFLKEKHE